MTHRDSLSYAVESIIGPPFMWCWVPSGNVQIEDASQHESLHKGTVGGEYWVEGYMMAKYPITNAQYQRFIDAPDGQSNIQWWTYSTAATQWKKDRPKPRQTAFPGADTARTRVSWFDSMAFCAWLSHELSHDPIAAPPQTFDIHDVETWCVRLPTEHEWQRAAVGDTDWPYPWGHELLPTYANYGNHVGHPVPVGSYPLGQSPYGVMDMVGNLVEWCRTRWGEDSNDPSGYSYRVVKGGAWNIPTPEYLRAIDRTGLGPRGVLNDAGFRCTYHSSRFGPVD